MSRYRPPSKPSSAYITSDGAARLRQELQYLWKVKRPAITQSVSEAAAQGDRSENAEYIYGKKQLREIDRRVRFLSKRLDVLKVIETLPREKNRIFFGARVKLRCDNNDIVSYRIVGPDEFDAEPEYISMDSPVAKSLLGKYLDDFVEVHLPSGVEGYQIIEIVYS